MTPRIVAGRFKGMRLQVPAGRATRPTSQRLREQVFDILVHRRPDGLYGARVADLFAGTGALGLEALSRGAASCVFVEQAPAALRALRANIAALNRHRNLAISVIAGPVEAIGAQAIPFDLLFLDPPYGRHLVEPALSAIIDKGWAGVGSLIAVETDRRDTITPPSGIELIDHRLSGGSALWLASIT